MIELKKCPHCGGTARLFASDNGVCVCCSKCSCRTRFHTDTEYISISSWEKGYRNAVEDAIEAWNKRVGEVETDG